jgi:2'-hydroxyisoflavone reductase
MGSLLNAIGQVTQSNAELTWIPESFLLGEGIAPWSELPLWVPREFAATFSSARAIAAGLTFRPLEQVIEAVFVDLNKREQPTAGALTRTKEQNILKKWHAVG